VGFPKNVDDGAFDMLDGVVATLLEETARRRNPKREIQEAGAQPLAEDPEVHPPVRPAKNGFVLAEDHAILADEACEVKRDK
jgi:hypothetical protein